MTEHDALLQTILAAPDDDTPRLVFADWVEEQGDAERAEFIRIQCERESLAETEFQTEAIFQYLHDREADSLFGCDWSAIHPGIAQRVALHRREEALLAEGRYRWISALPKISGLRWGEFERGFVESVSVRRLNLLEHHGDTIRKCTPVRRHRLRHLDAEDAAFLINHEFLEQLIELRVDDVPPDAGSLAILSTSPKTAGIRRLIVNGSDSAGQFVRWENRSHDWPGLTHLDLSHLMLDGPSARNVIEMLRPAQLAELRLYPAQLANETLRPFRANSWPCLRTLELYAAGLVSAQVELLLANPLPALCELHLPNNQISASGFATILVHAASSSLSVLNLWHNSLRRLSTELLREATIPSGLCVLNLGGCHLNPVGMTALIGLPGWENILVLSLADNRLGNEGIAALAAAGSRFRPVILNLLFNDITDRGIVALARSPVLEQVRSLQLIGNSFGEAGVLALTESPHLENLAYLSVDQLDRRSMQRLRSRFGKVVTPYR